MKYPLCFALLLTIHANADCFEPIQSFDGYVLEEERAEAQNFWPGSLFKGLILLSPEESSKTGLKNFSGVAADEVDLPGTLDDLKAAIEPIYFGLPLSAELVREVQKQIVLYYRDQGRPVVQVTVPAQNLAQGVLQLRIQEGYLDEVIVQGNRWYADSLIKNHIRLKEGETINANVLLDDIAWLNRNPFRQTQAIFTPGELEGSTSIEVLTEDRFPLRIYAGGDNTGTRISERARLFAGVTWGYAFMLDQILSYQYTCAPNVKEYQSHLVHYTAGFPWRHILTVYGGLSWTRPDISGFRSEGDNAQLSLRYEIPLRPFFNNFLQELQIGFDLKSTNNTLSFVGEISSAEQLLQDQRINISQLVLGYDLGWKVPCHEFGLNVLFFYAPGEILANQTPADFNSFRLGAKNQYLYGKMETYYLYTMPRDFALFIMGRFQKSARPLIASEQIQIGGYDTVRGYDESLYLGDNGVIGNLEIRSPDISFSRMFTRRSIDALYFLLFFDVGYAELITQIQDEERRAFMMSTGPGARYQINPYFSFRIDYGFKLQTVKQLGDTSLGKLHLGMLLSF